MVLRGEVYLVNFEPGRAGEQHGQRPALVVQGDSGNEFAASTIVAAMSTGASAHYPFRVAVTPKESGLRETSTIMCDQLRTISQTRLRRRLGRLSPASMDQVDRALHYSLGLFD